MSLLRRPATALLAAALAVPAAGCSAAGAAGAPGPAYSARFDDSGVTVTLTVRDWHDGAGSLDLTFAPDDEGFHLYSTDLPTGGVDGVGRPTTAHVAGALAATAPLTVHAQLRQLTLDGVNGAVPVYPDGPITATLPLRADGPGPATIHLGYAACSQTQGCLLPVDDHPVSLTVTDHGLTAVATSSR
ncbi:hypothetical protein [Kitasatospora cinereorecta]|uniref:hypothetical protein n=1 Tax=Kitasatospora cinereorecta TaxID=285560 RepID=UPI0031F8E4F0